MTHRRKKGQTHQVAWGVCMPLTWRQKQRGITHRFIIPSSICAYKRDALKEMRSWFEDPKEAHKAGYRVVRVKLYHA